jgi:hypothetical protein
MMKKTAFNLGLILALLLGACSQIPGLTPTPGTGPTVDSAATSDALFKTAVAQTLTARPSSTSAPITETATASPVLPPTDTPTATQAVTTPGDLTATLGTGTSDVPTATGGPTNLTSTATLAAGQVTAIWTLAIRTYGTQAPAVPFSQITLINKAKTEAYISLHVDLPEGGNSVIEYPVEGRIKIDAPVGFYRYVTWVGGRKMVGSFRLHQNDDISITLYRDRVVIK